MKTTLCKSFFTHRESIKKGCSKTEKRSFVGVDPQIDPFDNPAKNERFPDKHVLLHIFIRELC